MKRAALLAFVASCGRVDFDPAECSAQRMLHITGGNGGLAWFSQLWPPPAVIETYQPTYAYDDPSNAIQLAGPPHPLYARHGVGPGTSAYVAGTNETHTSQPLSTVTANGIELDAAAAALQTSLRAPVPVVAIGTTQPVYGPAPAAPDATFFATVDDAAAALDHAPDPEIYSSWYSPQAMPGVVDLARQLAFAANLFRAGTAATVIVRGTHDDPHLAFMDGFATGYADDLVGVMNGFYAELAADEPACGSLALSDNVVLFINGDTYKNPFDRNWGDGTPSNSNLVYARGNGFLVPGWFGAVLPTAPLERFDPITGTLDVNATNAQDVAAVNAAVLYAVSRGNLPSDGFQGLITRGP